MIQDRDLAELYGVTTGNLNKAVKRNIERFPERFMFQLVEHEFLRFQNGISSWGGTRKLPYVVVVKGNYVVVIQIYAEGKANFITAYVANNSSNKIEQSPRW